MTLELPIQFVELGKRRTQEILRLAAFHPHTSLVDAFAIAYLHGLWDGWQVCEKQMQKTKGEKQMSNEIPKAEKGTTGTNLAPVTRCKVEVLNVKDDVGSDGVKFAEMVTIGAVYSDDPDSVNRQWSQWTPAFNLSMTINNPGAFGRLKAGMEYYVDFTPVAD